MVAEAHRRLGELAEGLAACSAGLADDPDDAELLFDKGGLHHLSGDLTRAAACWEKVLTCRRQSEFTKVSLADYQRLAMRNLALLAEGRGDRAGALRLWGEILAGRPGDAEATARLSAGIGATTRPTTSPSA
jgi:tetratricopeptide (TPR) repeat protein